MISLTAEPIWFSFKEKLLISPEMVLGYFIFKNKSKIFVTLEETNCRLRIHFGPGMVLDYTFSRFKSWNGFWLFFFPSLYLRLKTLLMLVPQPLLKKQFFNFIFYF